MPRSLRLDLPLLVKELTEQAARRRTYVLRFVYAAVLFSVACALFYGNVWREGDSSSLLGQGRFLFERLVELQFWAIYLVFPALACTAITSEKERDCLALLMVTTLRPWEIIAQKLLSRLVPMFSFLLLSLPLMAVAYSYGGVTEAHLWSGIYLLVATCVQVGALSILCSAWFRTTPEAFVAAYVGQALICGFPGCGLLMYGPRLFQVAAEGSFVRTVAMSVPMGVFVAALLVGARIALVERAFVPHRNVLLLLFKQIDAVFNEANHLTGGVVLVKDSNQLPADDPVAWRETAKKSLGTVRYLFRVLTVLMLPILIVGTTDAYAVGSTMPVLHYLLWGIAVAMVASHAAGVVSSERSRQTLSVLLTTPIPGPDLLRQKLKGVRRLMAVLAVPFVSIVLFEHAARPGDLWGYPLLQLATVAVYLPFVAWVAMWIGLRLRTQVRAIMATLSLMILWVALPLGLRFAVVRLFPGVPPAWVEAFDAISPADIIRMLESRPRSGYGNSVLPELSCLVNLSLHAAIGFVARESCLRNADRWLGRIPEPAA